MKKLLSALLIPTLAVTAIGCSSGGKQVGSDKAPESSVKANDTASSSAPVTIEFAAGKDASGELERSIARFNQSQNKIIVKFVELPNVPNEQLTRYSTWFASKSETPDLLMTDVIWPAMFASAGWIAPIDEFADKAYLDKFWPSAVEVAKVDGKHYGIQGWTDVGLLFYRKDLLDKYGKKVPATWDELAATSKDILSKENNPNLTGYVFQGAKIEGATINWLESLWGHGGDVTDAGGKIKVDSEKGIQALSKLNDLIYKDKVSPVSVSTSNPNDNFIAFSGGNAIFMRNWPGNYASLKGKPVEGKVDIAPLPHGDGAGSHPSTGGWVYAISNFSKHKKEAWQVLQFFLSEAEQKSMALNASRIPTVKTVFNDPALAQAQPLFQKLPAILETAKSRPALRNYEQFSRSVQTEVNLALSGQKTPEQALKDAQKAIDSAGK